MRTKTKTLITLETRSRTIFRTNPRKLFGWCDRCGTETLLLFPEEAEKYSGGGPMDKHPVTGTAHLTETTEGKVLVCCGSPFNEMRVQKGENYGETK